MKNKRQKKIKIIIIINKNQINDDVNGENF